MSLGWTEGLLSAAHPCEVLPRRSHLIIRLWPRTRFENQCCSFTCELKTFRLDLTMS